MLESRVLREHLAAHWLTLWSLVVLLVTVAVTWALADADDPLARAVCGVSNLCKIFLS